MSTAATPAATPADPNPPADLRGASPAGASPVASDAQPVDPAVRARRWISSGSTFEAQIGYARAVVQPDAQGDWIFVAGTTGFDYAAMTLAEGVADQAEQALANIEAALAQAGASLRDVVRVTYILPDGADFEACWPVLRQRLGEARPAATMISARLLDARMRIEIEATAYRPRA